MPPGLSHFETVKGPLCARSSLTRAPVILGAHAIAPFLSSPLSLSLYLSLSLCISRSLSRSPVVQQRALVQLYN